MRWGSIIAAVPIFVLIAFAMFGVGSLLVRFIAENPLPNGGIVLFSFWLVIGIFYLAFSSDPL